MQQLHTTVSFRPYITEILLMERKESNQTNKHTTVRPIAPLR